MSRTDPSPDRPLAFFVSFHTYGTWLHGDARGSVDRYHNQPGAPQAPPDPARWRIERERMGEDPVALDPQQRAVVERTIREVCAHRGWVLHAVAARTNHVHGVVTANDVTDPDRVMNDWKAWGTRRLREAGLAAADQSLWARHGSTRMLWTMLALEEAIDYVLNRQGKPLD